MQKLIKIVTLTFTLSLVGGCTYLGVYKRDLPQGNLVDQTMVAQLQPGMSRDQVRSVMGNPLLEGPFDANQWDYLFRLDEAYGDVQQRRVTLTFANERLVDIATTGDLSRDIDLTPQVGPGPAPEGVGPEEQLTPHTPQTSPEPGPAVVPAGGTPAEREPDLSEPAGVEPIDDTLIR
ncbi:MULTISPECIES: outer membrane protein assembly factor BamE [Halomonadaceae]|uniref:outer membrane protein assembly factor BamE n=1 Tax=Halomonadaceae TaxID=28256 RepID=UPI0015989F41|nr:MULTISPECIES: outer membrane protein assembly factor BamE [Halomonas]QJQ95425.1 outer membrane protein assembly factor BamE [Halomonas sp. PA5]